HIPSTVRRADLPVPHAFLPHARVYPALSSSCVARRPPTITDSASRRTPQAPGNCPGARGRAGCEVSAIRSPLSSGVSPFLLSGCCFHERDTHTPRARLHRPESEQDQDGRRRHRRRRDAVDSGLVGYDGRHSGEGVQAIVPVPIASMRVGICEPLRRGARMSPGGPVLIFKGLTDQVAAACKTTRQDDLTISCRPSSAPRTSPCRRGSPRPRSSTRPPPCLRSRSVSSRRVSPPARETSRS